MSTLLTGATAPETLRRPTATGHAEVNNNPSSKPICQHAAHQGGSCGAGAHSGDRCGGGQNPPALAVKILNATGESDHPALECARCGKCRLLYSNDPDFTRKLEAHLTQLAEWRQRIGPAIPRKRAAVPFWNQPDMYERAWDKEAVEAVKAQRQAN